MRRAPDSVLATSHRRRIDLHGDAFDSIRGLQAAWLAFKLFKKVPPHLLLVKAFPPAPGADWTSQQVLSFGTRNAASTPANASAPSPAGGRWG